MGWVESKPAPLRAKGAAPWEKGKRHKSALTERGVKGVWKRSRGGHLFTPQGDYWIDLSQGGGAAAGDGAGSEEGSPEKEE